MASHPTSNLVVHCGRLPRAAHRGRASRELIHRSDRGSMENFFFTLKIELVCRNSWLSPDEYENTFIVA